MTTATNPSPPPPTLPPPQTFDIVPALSTLLARLLPPHASDPSSPTIAPLDPKDLAPEINTLKFKIQKARQAIAALPDVERSVEEQEGEIEGLVRRVGEMRGVLRGLGERDEKGG